jgi:hypothetical protein
MLRSLQPIDVWYIETEVDVDALAGASIARSS